ncbi:hypothetical protein DIE06_13780 [Burkholderia sp. Bp8998]|nr:hypothetical protein DIE06_13780 [Burkholderia sp. Bp8998]
MGFLRDCQTTVTKTGDIVPFSVAPRRAHMRAPGLDTTLGEIRVYIWRRSVIRRRSSAPPQSCRTSCIDPGT